MVIWKKSILQNLGSRIVICICLIAVILIITQEFFFEISPIHQLELKFLDSRFQDRGIIDLKDSAKVIIVDISSESSKEIPPPFNKWPWPREYFAKLIKNLNDAGARAIGIDVVMSEQDKFNQMNDRSLYNAIKKYKNIIVAGKTKIKDERLESLITEEENFENIFFSADSSIGLVDVLPDHDGVMRRYMPFILPFNLKKRIPTFSFAVLNKYFQLPNFYTANINPSNFEFSNIIIPKFDESSLLINFYGPAGTFPHVNFIDVIDDENFTTVSEKELGSSIDTWDDPASGYLFSGLFKDKIVLIGSTEPEDKDLFPVSFSKEGIGKGGNLMYGVEIHANVIQNVLDKNFLIRQSKSIEIFLIIFLTFFSFILTSSLKSIKIKFGFITEFLCIVSTAILIFLVFELSFYLFNNHNYVITMASPILSIALGYVGSTAYYFIAERKQKAMIKGMFSQYVSSDLVEELVSNPDRLRLGGERKELTVFFSDIAGFTSISESKNPEELVNLLNEYLSNMTEIIFEYKGTLDKFEGDAVMAFWGAPIPNEDHALACCRAAFAMQKKLIELRKKWKEENQPDIYVRMGINTGEMIVGNMGGKGKFDYTVIGDNVNLASRLEGANKEYGTSLIISQSTFEKVKESVVCRELDLLLVKGKTKPIKIFELLGLSNDNIDQPILNSLNHFNEGLKNYRQRNFVEAIKNFEDALKNYPEDNPSKIYLARCGYYLKNPPPENWDGAYVMTTK